MVAESMVIFAPMDQLGWRRASVRVAEAIISCDHVRNGPPEAVIISFLIDSGLSPTRHW